MYKKISSTLMITIFLVSVLGIGTSRITAATTINFDTYTSGGIIENQYQPVGVIFSSKGVIWGTFEASSPPNFLVGYGPGGGWPPVPPYPTQPVTFYFVVPGTSDAAVTTSVSLTLISVGWTEVTATAYDSSNNVVDTQVIQNLGGPWNGVSNEDPITLTGVGIHKVDIVTTDPYTPPGANYQDGWGIDDLNFETLSPLTVPVTIDIKPGSFPTSINLGKKGLLPVAILGSAEFDVTTIDPETIEIDGVSLAERGSKKNPKLAFSIEDVNGDSYDDLVAFFSVPELVEAEALMETTEDLTLMGNLKAEFGGTPISGTDSVRIVPP
jgi:hypothetical protein